MDKEYLYRFFTGKTSPEENKRIRIWMESSPENSELFYKERHLFDTMILLADEERIQKEIQKEFKIKRLFRSILKVAAIVILTLISNSTFNYYIKQQESVPMQTVSVPAGQRINLQLPDGTNVWLNARTTLQYPISFNKKNRQVTLDGEAYFEVHHDKYKPFYVQTHTCAVEVHGTNFNIDAYGDSDIFEAALMDGSISVFPLFEPKEKKNILPGNKAQFLNGKIVVSTITDYNPYRWKEGLICFEDESFDSIMKNFEKSYGISIVIKNRHVLDHFYSGKFRQTDGIEYALRVLQKDITFTYIRDDENNIIYIE